MISLTALAAMQDVPRSSPSAPLALVPAPKRARIMVVDDERMIAEQLTQVFTRMGYEVETFTDPFVARRRFNAAPEAFDLVFSDLAMPGLDGCALSKHMLGLRPLLPVLIYTGYLTDTAAKALQALGVRDIMPKPTSLAAITQTVARHVTG